MFASEPNSRNSSARELTAHAEPIGHEEHTHTIDLGQHLDREQFAGIQGLQDRPARPTCLFDVDLGHGSFVGDRDQTVGEGIGVEVVERVVDEHTQRRRDLGVVRHDEQTGRARPHDLHEFGETGVHRSGTTFVREGPGEAVELLEVLVALRQLTAALHQGPDADHRDDREQDHRWIDDRRRHRGHGERSGKRREDLRLADIGEQTRTEPDVDHHDDQGDGRPS